MIISFIEIIRLIIMSIYLGVIFAAILKRFMPANVQGFHRRIDWKLLRFSIYLTAPAIILHELAHKFVAIGFGFEAEFFAFYAEPFLFVLGIIALLMALSGSGFVFLVPGFVKISSGASPLVYSTIAFAGPAMNLFLWLGAAYLLKSGKIKKKYYLLALLTKRINMFLFIFNMLPIPGFDGSHIFRGLIQTIF